MATYIIGLIWSDAGGHPRPDGGDDKHPSHGHYVVFTDDEGIVPVNQMLAGGEFPDSDCADACTESILKTLGREANFRTLEREEQTTAQGTLPDLCRAGLEDNGVPCRVVDEVPPPGLMVMNPAWGGKIPPEDAGPYYAASRGCSIVVEQLEARRKSP